VADSHNSSSPESELHAFFKGKVVPISEAKVSVMTHALHYGTGVFEGIRGNWNDEKGTVFCVLGDGELQEGQVWESFIYYPKTKLTNLVCIVDWNKGQNDGYSKDVTIMYDNLQERISSFGWDTRLINGHSMADIRNNLPVKTSWLENPLCLILDTIKGKGFSFSENNNDWHHKIMTKKQYDDALKELNVPK